MSSYRAAGRRHLAKAKELLASGSADQVTYAALELRMTIESHVYATAEAYARELPEPRLSKWQPAKLLRELLRMDPAADRSGIISFCREKEPGVAGDQWFTLGEQKRMTLKEVEKAYNQLGSFLHIETVLDKADGRVRDPARVREICDALAAKLTDVYATTLHNFIMGDTSTLDCMLCGKPLTRRLDSIVVGEKLVTECGESCFATYEIERLDDGKILWTGQFEDVTCQHPGCDGTVQIWSRMLKPGNSFSCDVCRRASELRLGLMPVTDDASEPPAVALNG